MLAQRIATALVLLALLLPALWSSRPWPFVLLTLLLVGAAAWEWARLSGVAQRAALLFAGVLTALGLAVAASSPPSGGSHALWLAIAALWLLGGGVVLRVGPQAWAQWPRLLRLGIGIVLLAAAWWAMVQARTVGVNYLLSVLCIAWAADIAAYFGGRAFGRRKLAPTISPSKSWEGVASGMLGVLVLAAAWSLLDRHLPVDSASVFTLLTERFGVAGMMLAALALAAMSVVGDLFESLIKRAAGAKDSSALLPGHGGVLDRVDALLPLLPCALALSTW